MNYKIQQICYHLFVFYRVYLLRDIPVFWYKANMNVGDALNGYLIEKLTRRKIIWVNPKVWLMKHYLVIGSILHFASRKSVIWGSGAISEQREIGEVTEVLAVRGPLTQRLLQSKGISCPENYGDPALLLPRIYDEKVEKCFRLGIIPHYKDKNNELITKVLDEEGVCLIDVETDNVESFIDSVRACQHIMSSSLHGLIIANAYGVPSKWMILSDNVEGDGFKFRDYFASLSSAPNVAPFFPGSDMSADDFISATEDRKIEFDARRLIDQCPFRVRHDLA